MNAILWPLVRELKTLEGGMIICGLKVRVRAILFACDLPAIRKTLGLLSHNANKGRFVEKHNYIRVFIHDLYSIYYAALYQRIISPVFSSATAILTKVGFEDVR